MWGWSGKQEGPPDYIGVPNIPQHTRKMPKLTIRKELFVDLDKLKTVAKELGSIVVALNEELQSLRESVSN